MDGGHSQAPDDASVRDYDRDCSPYQAVRTVLAISIRNDRGEAVARKVVGVGALQPEEGRTLTLAVEVFTPGDVPAAGKGRNGR